MFHLLDLKNYIMVNLMREVTTFFLNNLHFAIFQRLHTDEEHAAVGLQTVGIMTVFGFQSG